MNSFLFLVTVLALGFSNFASAGDIDPGDNTDLGYVMVKTPWSGGAQPVVAPYVLVGAASVIDSPSAMTPGLYDVGYAFSEPVLQELLSGKFTSSTPWALPVQVVKGKTAVVTLSALAFQYQANSDREVVNSDLLKVDIGPWLSNFVSTSGRIITFLQNAAYELRKAPMLLPKGHYELNLIANTINRNGDGLENGMPERNFEDLRDRGIGFLKFAFDIIQEGQLNTWHFELPTKDMRAKINVIFPTISPRFAIAKTWAAANIIGCERYSVSEQAPLAIVRIKPRGAELAALRGEMTPFVGKIIFDKPRDSSESGSAYWTRIDNTRTLAVWPLPKNSVTTYEIAVGGVQREIELNTSGSVADIELKYLNVNDVLLETDDGNGNISKKYIPGSFEIYENIKGSLEPVKDVWGTVGDPRCFSRGLTHRYRTKSTVPLLEGEYLVKISYGTPDGLKLQDWGVSCPAIGDCRATQLP